MASSPNYTVTFTVGLIEKLAGIKKAPAAPSKAKQQLGPPSQCVPCAHARHARPCTPRAPTCPAAPPRLTAARCPPPARAAINPELLALKRQNAHLATALESSRQVGNLLLKNEEQELAKISQLTGELLKQYRWGAGRAARAWGRIGRAHGEGARLCGLLQPQARRPRP